MNIEKASLRRIVITTSIIIIAAVLVFSAIYIPISLKNSNAWTSSNMTDANRVQVGELYSNAGTLNSENIKTLNKYLFNQERPLDSISTPIDASQIRSRTYNGKTSSQSVIVSLGGLNWTVVYVSQSSLMRRATAKMMSSPLFG